MDDTRLNSAALGVQEYLRLTAVPVGAESKLGMTLFAASPLNVAGNWDCVFDVSGMTDVEAHVKSTVIANTVTASLISLMANQTTAKDTASQGATLASATQLDLTLTGLKGARRCRFRLALGASASATFPSTATAFAEWNGL